MARLFHVQVAIVKYLKANLFCLEVAIAIFLKPYSFDFETLNTFFFFLRNTNVYKATAHQDETRTLNLKLTELRICLILHVSSLIR